MFSAMPWTHSEIVGMEKMTEKIIPTINKGCTQAVSLIQPQKPPNTLLKKLPIDFI
jgi:hypothetical protein